MPEQPPSTRIIKASMLALHSPIPDRLTTFTARNVERKRIGFTFSAKDKRADFVAAYPELDDVCERIGFGWDLTLGSWCTNSSWALEELARSCKPRPLVPEEDWTSSALDELTEHIITHYHQPLRWELTRLGCLIKHVAHAHQQAELNDLATGFNLLRDSLLVHLMQEELDAFPLCIKLEQLSHDKSAHIEDGVRETLHFMAAGHLETVDDVDRLHLLAERAKSAHDPDLPVIKQGLSAMREELIQHTKIENDVLLPAAMFMADVLLTRKKSLS